MTTKPSTPKSPGKPNANAGKHAGVDLALGATPDAATDASVAPREEMRLKDLIDHVTAASGFKKKDVKLVVEATLAHIGDALHKGESMTLAGFGRLRVVRTAAEGDGAVTLKLRKMNPGAKPDAAATPEAGAPDAD
jgi:nucleoid DNA-binding protein